MSKLDEMDEARTLLVSMLRITRNCLDVNTGSRAKAAGYKVAELTEYARAAGVLAAALEMLSGRGGGGDGEI